jgi:hypothetical protein
MQSDISMKNNYKVQRLNSSQTIQDKSGDEYLTQIKKQEKYLSIGIYALIIIITVALMLILFNVVLKV